MNNIPVSITITDTEARSSLSELKKEIKSIIRLTEKPFEIKLKVTGVLEALESIKKLKEEFAKPITINIPKNVKIKVELDSSSELTKLKAELNKQVTLKIDTTTALRKIDEVNAKAKELSNSFILHFKSSSLDAIIAKYKGITEDTKVLTFTEVGLGAIASYLESLHLLALEPISIHFDPVGLTHIESVIHSLKNKEKLSFNVEAIGFDKIFEDIAEIKSSTLHAFGILFEEVSKSGKSFVSGSVLDDIRRKITMIEMLANEQHTIKINANKAIEDLNHLESNIKSIKSKSAKINIDTGTSEEKVSNLISKINSLVDKSYLAQIRVSFGSLNVIQDLETITQIISNLKKNSTITFNINTGVALNKIQNIQSKISALISSAHSATLSVVFNNPNINLEIKEVQKNINSLKASLNSFGSSHSAHINLTSNILTVITEFNSLKLTLRSILALSPINLRVSLATGSALSDIGKMQARLSSLTASAIRLTINSNYIVTQIQRIQDKLHLLTMPSYHIIIDTTTAITSANALISRLRALEAAALGVNHTITGLRTTVSANVGQGQGWARTFGDDLQRIMAVGFGGYMVKEGVKIVNNFISMSNALEAMLGSSENAAKANKYLRQTSQDLGVSFSVLTTEYTKFIASAKQANITSEEFHKTFGSVTMAASVLNFTAEQTHGIFKALGQMMSKGKVQAEELRGQLGEHLYGAFELVAQGMKKTTAELDEMLKKGRVTSRDMIIALPKALVEAYGPGLVKAVATGRAEFARFTNDIQIGLDNNKEAVDELIFTIAVSFRKALAAVSQDSSGMDTLTVSALTLGGALEIVGDWLGKINASVRFFAIEFAAGIDTMISKLVAFAKLMSGISLPNVMSKGFGEIGKSFEEYKKTMTDISNIYSSVSQYNMEDMVTTIDKIKASDKLLDFTRTYRNELTKINELQVDENEKIKQRNALVEKFLQAETPQYKNIFKDVVNEEPKTGPGSADYASRLTKAQTIINNLTKDIIKLHGKMRDPEGKDPGLQAALDLVKEQFREIGMYGKKLDEAMAKAREKYKIEKALQEKQNDLQGMTDREKMEKNIADIRRLNIDEEINGVHRVLDAKLDLYELNKSIFDLEVQKGNVSPQKQYEFEIDQIHKRRDAQLQALDVEKSLTKQKAELLNGEVINYKAAYEAIRQIESSNGRDDQLVNISYKKDGSYNGTALGPGQAMISTLLDPGYGMQPFEPASKKEWGMKHDQTIKELKEVTSVMEEFAIKYKDELDMWAEDYFIHLVKGTGSLVKAVQIYGDHTDIYLQKFLAKYGIISGLTEKQIGLTSSQNALEEQARNIRATATLEEQEAKNNLILKSEAYSQYLDQERVKLLTYTKTVKEVAEAEKQISLKYNTNYKIAKSSGGKPEDAKMIEQNAELEKQRKITKAADDYAQKLIQVSKRTKEVGINSTEAFDLIHQGLGGLSNSFDNFISSLDKIGDSLRQNAQDALENNRAYQEGTISLVDYSNMKLALDKESISLEDKKTKSSLTGIRQIVGATSNMFDEGTKGRKAFHALEVTLGGIELAYNLANNSSEIASNLAVMASNVATGATKIWAQMGIYAPIGLAIMAASLAAYGISGGSGGSAESPKTSPDTGTVLGDSSAQSDSISKIIDTLKSIHAEEYPQLVQINNGMNNLSSSISSAVNSTFQTSLDNSVVAVKGTFSLLDNVANSLTTTNGLIGTAISTLLTTGVSMAVTAAVTAAGSAAVAGGAAAGVLAGTGIGAYAGPIGMAVGAVLGLILSSFSGGYQSVEQQGIKTNATTANDSIYNGVDPSGYAVIKTRTWDWLSDSTEYDTVKFKLDDKLNEAINSIFASASLTMEVLAENLGSNLKTQVDAYVIPALTIDLKGLNAEDANKKIMSTISTTLDKMSEDLFGSIVGQYQKAGEGMLETAVRVVSDIIIIKDSIAASGLSISTDVVSISEYLVQLSGSIEDFQSQFSSFYDKFYTDEEKRILLQKQLTDVMSQYNMVLPATRDGYKNLVESLDLNNTKDVERYSIMLKLASAADEYYTKLADGLKVYEDAVSSAFSTASDILTNQVDTYKGIAKQLTDLSKSLISGSLSTSSPYQKYKNSKQEFVDIQNTLDNGTEAEKQTALNNLPSIIQSFLETSKSVNASGMGYVKDYVNAQGVLSKWIINATDKADVAQLQLDQLTEQVKRLGLIKDAVTDSTVAIQAVVDAIKSLDNYKGNIALTQNENRFNDQEQARKNAYYNKITEANSGKVALAQKYEGMLGFSAQTSSNPFYASGLFDSSTGGMKSEVYTQASGGNAGLVNESLKSSIFGNVKGALVNVSNMLKNLIGGTLPDVSIMFGDDQENGEGYLEYIINGIKTRINSDNLPIIEKSFADSMTDYLADQMVDKDLATKIKDVSFPSFSLGIANLTKLLAEVKKPYVGQTYDPTKTYANGGVFTNGIVTKPTFFNNSLMGENGPEAILPLVNGPKGLGVRSVNDAKSIANSIINQLSASSSKNYSQNNAQDDNSEVILELRNLVSELKESNEKLQKQNELILDSIEIDKFGYNSIRKGLKENSELERERIRKTRIGVKS